METTKSKKKILILGRPKSGKLSLVKALTSSLPHGLTDSTPHAGLTHSITLTTRYFSTEAGIWIDEIPEDLEPWLDEYLSQEATPVLRSLAVIILTIGCASGDTPAEKDLEILEKLNERGEEVEWDATSVVIGKRSSNNEVYSSISLLCDEHALEFINLNESGENEFGGILVAREILLTRQKNKVFQGSWKFYIHATGHLPPTRMKNQWGLSKLER
jgi:hypothetical protein